MDISNPSVQTHVKKFQGQALTWSDNESDGSQEEDDMVSNLVAFSSNFVSSNRVLVQGHSRSVVTYVVYTSVKSYTVATKSKIIASSLCDSDSDNRDESENDNESLQEAYERMCSQWLRICATN